MFALAFLFQPIVLLSLIKLSFFLFFLLFFLLCFLLDFVLSDYSFLSSLSLCFSSSLCFLSDLSHLSFVLYGLVVLSFCLFVLRVVLLSLFFYFIFFIFLLSVQFNFSFLFCFRSFFSASFFFNDCVVMPGHCRLRWDRTEMIVLHPRIFQEGLTSRFIGDSGEVVRELQLWLCCT